MTESNVKEQVLKALESVLDPEIGRDLVSLGMVKDVTVKGTNARVVVELTTPADPMKAKIESDVREAITGVAGIGHVDVVLTARVRSGIVEGENPLPGVKNSIAIASGKGGVGKSTVALSLAMALIEEGAKVGLLDCDIYGPSIPKMTGTSGVQPEASETKFLCVERHGLKIMSIGYLVPPGQAVIWRGPLVHKAVQQFVGDVDWGELDYLFVDLPPGTGDAQLSLSQTLPLTGAVLVTTPQEVSVLDVRKAADMFVKVDVPLLGVVENMSFFLCPGSEEPIEIFGRGGGRKIAEELDVPFLGEVPLEVAVREGGDLGIPCVVSHPEAPSSKAFVKVACDLAGRISRLHLGGNLGFGA